MDTPALERRTWGDDQYRQVKVYLPEEVSTAAKDLAKAKRIPLSVLVERLLAGAIKRANVVR